MTSSPEAQKAQGLMLEARKRQESFSWPWSGNSKHEEAAELYKKAANLFKLSKEWDQAGYAFVKTAECFVLLQSKHEVAENYINASNCFKKSDIQAAIRYLKMGIEFYIDEGRFSIAGRHQKEIAEMYESENDYESAMECYKTAADYYEGEGQTSHANTCLLKVAYYAAELEQYQKAIEIYEQVATTALENSLLKWSVKDYLFRAGICHLCIGDLISIEKALEKYQTMDHTFSNQRECKLLCDIVDALKENDVQKFTDVVADFNSISALEPWKTKLLLRVKNKMKEAGEDIL